MGLLFSSLVEKLFAATPARVCMIGLDGAGKTSILYKMKHNELVHTIPTIGFNVETIEFKNLCMTVWDVGGQTKIRPLWQHYFENNDAVIYVVDSCDQERMNESREELWSVLSDDRLRDTVLLVMANKQDLPMALNVSEITDKLDLRKLNRCQWFVQGTSAPNGEGLIDGFSWMADTIKAKSRRRNHF